MVGLGQHVARQSDAGLFVRETKRKVVPTIVVST